MIKSYILLISIPFLLLVQGCATTQSRFKDPFTEAIYLTQVNHIDEHDMKELVFKAVTNIENEIDSRNYDIEKIEIDWENPDNDYISVSQAVYDHYTANSGDHAKDLIYGSLSKLLKDLDPASSLMRPSVFEGMKIGSNVGGIGVQIKMVEESPVILTPIENSPAEKAGIKPGDRITQIDGTTVQGLKLHNIALLLRGPLNSTARINIKRDNIEQVLHFEIKREIIRILNIRQEFAAPEVAYIKMKQFQRDTSQELLNILNSMKELKGLILDLRDNPGGLLKSSVDVSDIFLEQGLVVTSIRGRNQNEEVKFRTYSKKTRSDCPMIILVNHKSAAASEIVAGALRTYKRALILGTKTFGRGTVQTVIPIRDGSALRLTTANIYLADGSVLKSDGINPDIILKKDESPDSDNQLDLALRLIKKAEGMKSHSAIAEMLDYYKSAIAGYDI
jgi:carboxyl-terminal processing protease